MLTKLDNEETFYGVNVENINKTKHAIRSKLIELEEKTILEEINTMPKLRTYKTLQTNLNTPIYIKSRIEKSQKSTITKLRIGIYPINIETGRHRKEKLEERTCPACKHSIEDETHFLVNCPLYEESRETLYKDFDSTLQIKMNKLSVQDRLKTMLSNPKTAAKTANLAKESYNIRYNYIKSK